MRLRHLGVGCDLDGFAHFGQRQMKLDRARLADHHRHGMGIFFVEAFNLDRERIGAGDQERRDKDTVAPCHNYARKAGRVILDGDAGLRDRASRRIVDSPLNRAGAWRLREDRCCEKQRRERYA